MVTTVLTLISCSMAGYALGRYNLKISKLCMVVAVLTIIVPIQTYIIPYFFQFRFFSFFGILNVVEWITGNSDVYLHLNNTELTYYLPAALGAGLRSGLFVIVFMQFFKGLPKELEDAPCVDGCSEAGLSSRLCCLTQVPLSWWCRCSPSSGTGTTTISLRR